MSIPATRGECPKSRPCPHVSCRYHLRLDVTEHGGLQTPSQPALQKGAETEKANKWIGIATTRLVAARETCALDVADQGGITLEEVGRLLGITRERARQIEAKGLVALKRRDRAGELEAAAGTLHQRQASPLGETIA